MISEEIKSECGSLKGAQSRRMMAKIRGELRRRRGTMLSFDDKLIVLRVYSNLTIDSAMPSFNSICKLPATALHTVRLIIAEHDKSGGDIHNMCAKSSCISVALHRHRILLSTEGLKRKWCCLVTSFP